MKRMKTVLCIIACLALMLGLSACGSTASETKEDSKSEIVTNDPAESADEDITQLEEPEMSTSVASDTETSPQETSEDKTDESTAASGKDTLVVVFSATGTTKGVADKIAAITDADIYEIKAAEPYSDADLNWNDSSSRSTKEQNDASVRPAIGSETISLEGYKTIFVGYPIWWGEEPRIMDTFVESYSFDGITMIPFCTSSSSGIGRSGKNLAEKAGSGSWLDGARFSGSVSEDELQSWIEGLR